MCVGFWCWHVCGSACTLAYVCYWVFLCEYVCACALKLGRMLVIYMRAHVCVCSQACWGIGTLHLCTDITCALPAGSAAHAPLYATTPAAGRGAAVHHAAVHGVPEHTARGRGGPGWRRGHCKGAAQVGTLRLRYTTLLNLLQNSRAWLSYVVLCFNCSRCVRPTEVLAWG